MTQNEIKQYIQNQKIFQILSNIADQLNMDCYLIGGYVRDLLLNRKTNDIDIVVIGSGIKMAEFVNKQLLGSHLSIFKRFGTAQVKWKHHEIEFVGARKESYSPDSRKPAIEEGSLIDDQNRRDFTINALAISLNSETFGNLLDPFEGLHDLNQRLIKTPLDPDKTFCDDPLRMLRCIRFATQLNFKIQDETFQAIKRNKERIKIISAERISSEINKILLSKKPSIGFLLLYYSGLLDLILPELSLLDNVETKNNISHKNNFYHTLEVLDNISEKTNNLTLRWAALLHDIGKPKTKKWEKNIGWTFHNHNYIGLKMVRPIFSRLKLPLDERMKYVQKLVNLHMRPIVIADDKVTDSAVRRLLFDAGNDIEDLMLLCEADITSKNQKKKERFLENFKLVRKKIIILEEKDRIRNFQPPVKGEEIMKMFNLSPSPIVGTLKSKLKDAVLDGLISNDYDAAILFLKQQAKKLGISHN